MSTTIEKYKRQLPCTLYICVSGIEGIGKTTACKNIAEAFRKIGLRVFETKEPGSKHSTLELELRKLMLDAQYESQMVPIAREYISQAIRALNLSHTLLKKVFYDSNSLEDEEYDIVIQDRGLLDGLAYGEACGNNEKDLLDLYRLTSSEFRKRVNPSVYDLVLLTTVAPNGEKAREAAIRTFLDRAKSAKKEFVKGDVIEEKGVEFQIKVDSLLMKYSTPPLNFFNVELINISATDSEDTVTGKCLLAMLYKLKELEPYKHKLINAF